MCRLLDQVEGGPVCLPVSRLRSGGKAHQLLNGTSLASVERARKLYDFFQAETGRSPIVETPALRLQK